jgi:magnesium chelatase accessory protein
VTGARFVDRLRDRADPGGEGGLARPDWETDGRDWPNRAFSRFVTAAGLRWHVQVAGNGPVLLLLHGTGAATHSWAGLLPLLAARFTVVAPDLPGHGFTAMPPPARMSLPAMAEAVAGLLAALEVAPELAAGHSAGAAILCRMCLDGRADPRALVSLNGALLPFRGLPGQLFSPMARLAASTSVLPRLFAWHAGSDRAMIERLIRDTGSSIGGVELSMYRRLARRPGHIAAALAMMAHWDLHALVRDLPRLRPPLTLVVGARDRAVRPAEARRVRDLVPGAQIVGLPGLGHLAHEERPAEVAALIIELSAKSAPMPAAG